MKTPRFCSLAVLLISASTSVVLACGSSAPPPAAPAAATAPDRPLYERLGGVDAITAVVDDFLKRTLADDRINARFLNADKAKLRQGLIDQICEVSGGPCKYTGKDMVTAHKGMNLTNEEFNAMVEDLVQTLDAFKVPAREKGELLSALGGMRGDIVGQ